MNYQSLARLPTEFSLTVGCCRQAWAGDREAMLDRLARSVDWDRFLATCRRHRVEGLAWRGLGALAAPEPIREALSGDARRIAEQGLRAALESAALREAFERAGIPLLFVKGLTVGRLAYGDPFLKMGWDIDLLVPAGAIVEAGRRLARIGYSPVVPAAPDRVEHWHRTSKESIWRKADGTTVELHSRLADNPRLIPTIDACSPRRMVEVAPGILLPTLADDLLFAYLCVHGASSAWFRLKWITDLAALLHRRSEGEIAALYERSQALGAGRAAAQALLLAGRLYGTPVGAALDRPITRWLAARALRQMTNPREPTERPLGTLTIHLTQGFLLPGVAFTMSELRRQARAAWIKA